MQQLVLDPGKGKPNLATGSVQFIGTATVLLKYAGFTILTDPNFLHRGDHVHLGYGLTSKRLTDPALDIDDLPPLDLVLLSHLHGDHWDRVAEAELDRSLPIVTTRHAAKYLRGRGFRRAAGLRRWEAISVRRGDYELRITAMPGKHGPGLMDSLLPPVMGSMLDFFGAAGQHLLRIYITGDTLIHDQLHDIPRRFPNVDLALLHLGGTRVLGVLVTMDAEQGVEMLRIIEPDIAIPIHYNDYTVFKSPLADFKAAARAAGFEERLRYLSHGESYSWRVPTSRIKH